MYYYIISKLLYIAKNISKNDVYSTLKKRKPGHKMWQNMFYIL